MLLLKYQISPDNGSYLQNLQNVSSPLFVVIKRVSGVRQNTTVWIPSCLHIYGDYRLYSYCNTKHKNQVSR